MPDPSQKPLVLSLLPRPPHPAREGAGIRNFHLLKGLATAFRVRAISLMPPGADELPWEFPDGVDWSLVPLGGGPLRTVGSALRSVGGEPYVVAKYRSGALDDEVHRVVREEAPAWVVAHSYHVAPAALAADRPLWVDFHNVDSIIWQRLSRSAPSPFVRLGTTWQAPLVKRYEDRLYRLATGFSAVSELDAEVMRSRSSGTPPIVVPNGVDLERYAFRRDPPEGQTLLFVGDLRWHPNANGVAWFVKSVWPILRAAAPEARVEILGRGATDALLGLADDRLSFIGGVPDTRPAWERAAIGIVPLLTGGGTRLKILEAAAMGVPVVSTSVGAEGLALTPEDSIVIRDEPGEWATAIAGLLADGERRRRMAAAARTQVEGAYDWATIGGAFAQHLSAKTQERDPSRT